jgi:hypothetical protein
VAGFLGRPGYEYRVCQDDPARPQGSSSSSQPPSTPAAGNGETESVAGYFRKVFRETPLTAQATEQRGTVPALAGRPPRPPGGPAERQDGPAEHQERAPRNAGQAEEGQTARGRAGATAGSGDAVPRETALGQDPGAAGGADRRVPGRRPGPRPRRAAAGDRAAPGGAERAGEAGGWRMKALGKPVCVRHGPWVRQGPRPHGMRPAAVRALLAAVPLTPHGPRQSLQVIGTWRRVNPVRPSLTHFKTAKSNSDSAPGTANARRGAGSRSSDGGLTATPWRELRRVRLGHGFGDSMSGPSRRTFQAPRRKVPHPA